MTEALPNNVKWSGMLVSCQVAEKDAELASKGAEVAAARALQEAAQKAADAGQKQVGGERFCWYNYEARSTCEAKEATAIIRNMV
jgi:hypothetical protein